MSRDVSISRARPERLSQDFQALRDTALAQIQTLAEKTWTDHNLHDPGIAIMEAFCYAMTELGLKLDLDMGDLIASGAARAAPVLPPAQAVLPVAPVTMQDLRTAFLDNHLLADCRISTAERDRVDYFRDAPNNPPLTFLAPADPGPARLVPSGLYQVLLAFRDPALNSNAFAFNIVVGADQYAVEISLPYWDEPGAAPFLTGENAVTAVALQNPATPWRQLEENLAFFAMADVDFNGPGGAASIEMPLVMRIGGALDPAALTIPQILAGAQAIVEDAGAGGLLAQYLPRVAAARTAARSLERALIRTRRLTEAPLGVAVSRVQEIAVNARIEVARTTAFEELLADILFELERQLSPAVEFVDPAALRADGQDSGDILNGPLLLHGVAPQAGPGLVRGDTIFTSDILNILMRGQPRDVAGPSTENPLGRDIVSVTDLSLTNFINNRPITAGASNCLRLVDIQRHRPAFSMAKSRIVLVRDMVDLPYDLTRVETLLAARRAEVEAAARLPEYAPDPTPPPVEIHDIGAYYPFQYDLPRGFGVSPAGLPPEATPERRQQAHQLRAYLLLMEQFLADATEQLANINHVFSPAGSETTSYYTRALTDIDGMENLVRRDPAQPWPAFAADPANSYVRALASAVEDTSTLLDRRNRMLDHLLARQGEEMAGWGQERHRAGQRALLRTTVNLAALPQRVEARRQAVNRALVHDKAAYLADLPRLHGLRLQGFGDPADWDAGLITVSGTPGQYHWQIVTGGVALLEAVSPSTTRGEAVARAREALRLSGRAGFYSTADLGGANNRRYLLHSEVTANAPILARGPQGFATLALSQQAAATARAALVPLLNAQSRTAFERRIDHQIGIRLRTTRPLLSPLSDFFAVVDAAPAPPFAKVWRLHRDPGAVGPVLLQSAGQFVDGVEAVAIAAAEAGVERVLEFGLDDWNYRVAETAPGSFALTLVDMDEVALATAPAAFASQAQAEAARDAVIGQLYAVFSAEGFHMVETLLVRPSGVGDSFLILPDADGIPVEDPYSHRVMLVFPSGYERDFALGTTSRRQARPHRFRDTEFRRHAERVIRQSCPAHILPSVHWVDRRIAGTQNAAGSFDIFATRYAAWLATQVMPGAPAATEANARNALVSSLNAIAGG